MAPFTSKFLTLATGVSSAVMPLDSSLLVDAHQNVILTAPTFTNYAERLSPLAFLEKQNFKTTADFVAYYKAKDYTTRRAFMDDKGAYKATTSGADFECDYTNIKGKAQLIPSASTIRSTARVKFGSTTSRS